jgi:peroxiredoxin
MDGNGVSNKDYTGKPTLLIFYVGHHCTHCMEQLRTFEPLAAEFTKQGINIVALSPDSVEDLPKANKWSKTKGGFPMKLVSADVATFRNYRAHDDFEQFPLHAVALVDAQQRLRWLDVSYQPFQDVKFLIEESKRLLALPQIEKVEAQ